MSAESVVLKIRPKNQQKKHLNHQERYFVKPVWKNKNGPHNCSDYENIRFCMVDDFFSNRTIISLCMYPVDVISMSNPFENDSVFLYR